MHALEIDILTIFPGLIEAALGAGMPRIAGDKGLARYRPVDLREFTSDRHRSVDDRPYGGGPGMVMRAEPILRACEELPADEPVILLTPAGTGFDQAMARELAALPRFALICGRYEGIDERVRVALSPREVSLGDFVLSGGELAAAVIIDAVVRLLPGVLGDETSAEAESFTRGDLLDHPHYTRPEELRGLGVPEVLLSGDHAAIAAWRRQQAEIRTAERRSP